MVSIESFIFNVVDCGEAQKDETNFYEGMVAYFQNMNEKNNCKEASINKNTTNLSYATLRFTDAW